MALAKLIEILLYIVISDLLEAWILSYLLAESVLLAASLQADWPVAQGPLPTWVTLARVGLALYSSM